MVHFYLGEGPVGQWGLWRAAERFILHVLSMAVAGSAC